LKLYNLYKHIILEASVRNNDIVDSIDRHKVISIFYDGDGIENRGYRDIEPYCYGNSKDDNPVLRGYQLAGVTDTEVPGWKLFRIDKIVSWDEKIDNNISVVFNEPQDGFNPNGDNGMNRVIKIAKFKNYGRHKPIKTNFR